MPPEDVQWQKTRGPLAITLLPHISALGFTLGLVQSGEELLSSEGPTCEQGSSHSCPENKSLARLRLVPSLPHDCLHSLAPIFSPFVLCFLLF